MIGSLNQCFQDDYSLSLAIFIQNIPPAMRTLSTFFCSIILSFGLLANYDETVDGDLSGDRLNPTVISVMDGSNVVSATSIAGDVEYFTITVPVGGTLDAINLTAFSSISVAFLAFQEGTIFSLNPGIPDLLGWTHLGLPLEDKLPVLAASGGIGFAVPLPAGTYTFWAQETAASPSSYSLDFVISFPPTVPTMSEWSIIVLGLLMSIFVVIGVRNELPQLSV